MFLITFISLTAVVLDTSSYLCAAEDIYNDIDDIVTLGRRACPYVSFCSGNVSANSANPLPKLSCCYNCSCTPDCVERRNCCPDVIQLNYTSADQPETQVGQKCFSVHVVNPIFLNTAFKRHIMYKMVTSCPNGKTCALNKWDKTQDLKDLVVVHSNMDGRIYRNRGCAQCNRATDLVE